MDVFDRLEFATSVVPRRFLSNSGKQYTLIDNKIDQRSKLDMHLLEVRDCFLEEERKITFSAYLSVNRKNKSNSHHDY